MPRLFRNLQRQDNPYDHTDCGNLLEYSGNRWRVNDRVCDGHYTFVVLPDNNPFGGFFQDWNGNSIYVRVSKTHHHDNLAAGAQVHYAGTLDFDAGILIKWSNHSGHYQPYAICRDQAPKNFDPGLFEVVLNNGSLAGILNNGDPA